MQEGKLHYGWLVIFMGLLTTIAAHGFGRMAYTIILPAMSDGLDFNYTQMGLLGTGNFIGYLTMAIVGGFLAAHFGTRIIITAALILMGITMILTGLAQSFGFAFAMRLLCGLGNGAAFVPAMALGSAWFTVKKRGFATGIISAGIGAGTLISGLAVPPILSAFSANGWRFSWYILGGAVLLISGIVYQFVRSNPQEKGLRQVGFEKSEGAQPNASATEKVAAAKWSDTVRRIIKMGSVWYLGVVYFFFGLSYIIYMVFFCGLSGHRIGPQSRMGRGVMGAGRWVKHFLRGDLGQDIGLARQKLGGRPGVSCSGAVLYHLCPVEGRIGFLFIGHFIRSYRLEHPHHHGCGSRGLCRPAPGACRAGLYNAIFWHRPGFGPGARRLSGRCQWLIYTAVSGSRRYLPDRDGTVVLHEETDHGIKATAIRR